jgi:hypothetical protein
MERISGPYKGYFIAAHTVRREGLHSGFAAICVDKPDSVRLAHVLQAAESQARYVIDGLLPNWAPFTAPGAFS